MSYTIIVNPINLEYKTLGESSLLDDAINSGINLPHSCKNGKCGACKSKIVNGKYAYHEYEPNILTKDELDSGVTLLCKAHAMSDLEISFPGFVNGHPIRSLNSKIKKLEFVNPTTAVLTLQLPLSLDFQYNPGQYIDIMFEGKNRSYSMASIPNVLNEVELHIRYRKGGVFSEALWDKVLVEDSLLRFRGPLGGFGLQHSDKPILAICTGTGFAPIKAILNEMYENNNQRKITLLWGNYTQNDFYQQEELVKWQSKLNIEIVLATTEQQVEGYYFGRVTNYLLDNFTNLQNHEVYACGNYSMVSDLYDLTVSKLLLAKNYFFSDAFTPSK